MSLLLRLSGFHLDSPSTCVPTRRSTHMAQNVHACHRDCISRFDEGNQVGDDRLVHTALVSVFPRTVPSLPELLLLLVEGLDFPADFSRCLHIALRCPIAALRIAESTLRFLVSSFATAGTPLTSRHQFPLAWADCSRPPLFASIDPRLHTTLSRFVEHVEVSVVPEIVPWPSPD